MSAILSPLYDVELAEEGESGLKQALENPPDLIVCDVLMPKMDGYELCRRWRAAPSLRDIPFVMMTSSTDPDGRALGLEEGADDYLAKSCGPREFLARVRSLLRLRKAQLEIVEQKEAIARAHEELLEAQRQLYESEKMATLGTVASGVAHELNNPLAFVLAGVEQMNYCFRELAGERPNARAKSAVLAEVEEIRSDIAEGADRVRRLVRDLNLLAGDPDRKPVWLEPRIELERALTIGQSKLIDVRMETRFEHRGELRLTPGYLTQIALSLLSNAADAVAGRPKREILLATRSLDDESFELVVQDTGSGIPPDLLPRIFEPFFTTKPAGKGMGLGLSVCAGLIKRLGGNTQVESTPGKGCRFIVTLPTLTQDSQTDFMNSRVHPTSAPVPADRH